MPVFLLELLKSGITALIPKLAELWNQYGQVIMGYLKGRQSQRLSDELKTLKTEARQASEINKEIEDAQRKRVEAKFDDTSDSDPNVRVRNPNVKW